MPAYFDSSVLLSILLNDKQSVQATEIWNSQEEKVSSLLLEAECLMVLRRAATQFEKKLPGDWLKKKEEDLKGYLEWLDLITIDSEVLEILWSEPRLSGCRALDALHLAAALFLKSGSDLPFSLATYDQEMKKVASQVGLEVLSKDA